jgi:hypothetical protein
MLQKQEPLKVWTMNNNYFLDAFEEYYLIATK